jgi:hypothetical protein
MLEYEGAEEILWLLNDKDINTCSKLERMKVSMKLTESIFDNRFQI